VLHSAGYLKTTPIDSENTQGVMMNKQITPTITRRLGRQSDLARELGITASAVSQLCKKYGVPKDMAGLIDLDYAAFLVRQKGNEKKQQAQRAKPKPAPRPDSWNQRDFLARLCPVWEASMRRVIAERCDEASQESVDTNTQKAMDITDIFFDFWLYFHEQLDQAIFNQRDMTASEWPTPPLLVDFLEQCEKNLVFPSTETMNHAE